MVDDELVKASREGPVATVMMNRPEALNALSLALEAELIRNFVELGANGGVRVIILTGAGRAFSAGVDLRELGDGPAALRARTWHGTGSLAAAMSQCPKQIIAAVNGFAITGGLELALQADFIIASSEAKFADTHARVGITPSWGMTQILPRLIGINRARQMSLTGQFVSAAQAESWGFVNEVVEPGALLARALEIAAEIAETDEIAARKIHELIDASASGSLEDGLALEREIFNAHIAAITPETIEANRRRVQARGRRVTGAS